MIIVKVLRAVIGIVYSIVFIGLLAFPIYPMAAIYCFLCSPSNGMRFRNRLTWHTTWYGERLFFHLCAIFGVKVRFHFSEIDFERIQGSLLVIANHQSLLDTPLICAVVHRVKRTHLRWVLKKMLLWVPPFGPAGWITHCAFVKRLKGDPEDRMQLEFCANSADKEGGDIVVFPEGTRFTGAIPGSEFAYLRDPKPGGVYFFLRRIPAMSVLSVTLRWSGARPGRATGRGFLDALDIVGQTLDIWVEHVPRSEIDRDPNWLVHHWRGKEERLWKADRLEHGGEL